MGGELIWVANPEGGWA